MCVDNCVVCGEGLSKVKVPLAEGLHTSPLEWKGHKQTFSRMYNSKMCYIYMLTSHTLLQQPETIEPNI